MDIKHPTKNNGRKGRCVGANILTWNLEIIRILFIDNVFENP